MSDDRWILTYSGVEFDPFDPQPEKILIEDIAHALSLTCRFSGHVRRFYSVAQHSLLVAGMLGGKSALWGLLHDASEAYLNDVSRPAKHDPVMDGYRTLERKLQAAIYQRFGLNGTEPHGLKVADAWALGLEAHHLMVQHDCWDQFFALGARSYGNAFYIISRLEPEAAEKAFLAEFGRLISAPARMAAHV